MAYSISGDFASPRKSQLAVEHFDSILERDYMSYLDSNPAVAKWTKKHGIKIPYTFLGFKRDYLPDFLVEMKGGSKEIHETKGLPFLLWLSVKVKRQSAEEWCKNWGYKYKFITRSTIPFYNPEGLSRVEGSQKLD